MDNSTSATILPFAAGNLRTRCEDLDLVRLETAMSRLSSEGDLWLGVRCGYNRSASRLCLYPHSELKSNEKLAN